MKKKRLVLLICLVLVVLAGIGMKNMLGAEPVDATETKSVTQAETAPSTQAETESNLPDPITEEEVVEKYKEASRLYVDYFVRGANSATDYSSILAVDTETGEILLEKKTNEDEFWGDAEEVYYAIDIPNRSIMFRLNASYGKSIEEVLDRFESYFSQKQLAIIEQDIPEYVVEYEGGIYGRQNDGGGMNPYEILLDCSAEKIDEMTYRVTIISCVEGIYIDMVNTESYSYSTDDASISKNTVDCIWEDGKWVIDGIFTAIESSF